MNPNQLSEKPVIVPAAKELITEEAVNSLPPVEQPQQVVVEQVNQDQSQIGSVSAVPELVAPQVSQTPIQGPVPVPVPTAPVLDEAQRTAQLSHLVGTEATDAKSAANFAEQVSGLQG